jgi:hypothetical protein
VGDCLDADVAGASRAVLDDDVLSAPRLDSLADEASEGVDRAARRERRDDLHLREKRSGQGEGEEQHEPFRKRMTGS